MTTTAPSTQSESMTATDRCDRCGAQAYVRVLLASGGELQFCSHHGREYRSALQAVASDIHDESEKLAATSPTAGADER